MFNMKSVIASIKEDAMSYTRVFDKKETPWGTLHIHMGYGVYDENGCGTKMFLDLFIGEPEQDGEMPSDAPFASNYITNSDGVDIKAIETTVRSVLIAAATKEAFNEDAFENIGRFTLEKDPVVAWAETTDGYTVQVFKPVRAGVWDKKRPLFRANIVVYNNEETENWEHKFHFKNEKEAATVMQLFK